MNSHIQLTSKCVCMCAKSLHSCLTLCIPMDCGPSGSSIRRILQAKMMEWVALPPLGDLPDPGIKPASLTSPTLAGGFFTTSATWEAHQIFLCCVTQSCPTLCDTMDGSLPDSSVHGDSPGKNTGVGCHDLLQVIFPTQRLNPGLLHCRWILYHLSYQGSPQTCLLPTYF